MQNENESLPRGCLKTSELAERLGVGTGTIRRWVRQGLLPALHLPNGRFAFDPDATAAILTPQRKGDSDGQ
jgi:excisionase family DNA binding protein